MPVTTRLDAPPGLCGWRVAIEGTDLALLEWDARAAESADCLTRSEAEVLGLVLAGLSNAEMAARRTRSVHTIANQLASIYRKLGVGSRAELFAYFACAG